MNINDFYLTVHPDLPTYQATYKNKSITLLGYMVDPDNPYADNSEIINGLIYQLGTEDNFFEHTDKFGGRWILIVNDGKALKLFNDAAGLRQVFYTDVPGSTDLWCASQPGLIAETLHLETAPEASEFMNSHEYIHNKHHWWPGDSSPYREIKHLLPNHYLDLGTGRSHRYWPNASLDSFSLREAVLANSQILYGLMKSMHNRFNLALSLSAGWDSRVLLATTKEMGGSLFAQSEGPGRGATFILELPIAKEVKHDRFTNEPAHLAD